MNDQLTRIHDEKKTDTLELIIKNLRLALKNSVFYPPDHPIFSYSVNNLAGALNKWHLSHEYFEVGFSKETLFVNGQPTEEGGFALEVANFLHMRGLISIRFLRGLENHEIAAFLTLIRNDRKTIQEKGGISEHLRAAAHIQTQEIDYRKILESRIQAAPTKDREIWQFLLDTANEADKGNLPDSKIQFLDTFFADTKKSVQTLNRIYHEAVSQTQDESAGKKVRETICKICKFYDARSPEESRDLKVKMMNVVSQLHPDLINTLFDDTVQMDAEYDLAEMITGEFSEAYIAEFIESLISHEDTFNENLLKVFDKLAPGAEASDNVITMVADKLFSKRIVNPETLSKMQMSIRDIFKRHPESNFMNQIYKITVDAVMNQKIDTLVYVARLNPLITKFVQSIEHEHLKKEEIWLLLNLLWLENNADDYARFTDKLINVLPELLNANDTERIREIVEFFADKARPEQKRDQRIVREMKDGLEKLTDDITLHHLISILPKAENKVVKDIAYILKRTGRQSAKVLLNVYLEDKNPIHRKKFELLFSVLRTPLSEEVIERFEFCEPHLINDLFGVLSQCSVEKAHLISRKLLTHPQPQIRWEAYRYFQPEDMEEHELLFGLFKKETHEAVKKQIALGLLKSDDDEFVHKLFKYCRGGMFRKSFLVQLIALCGHARTEITFDYLQGILTRRPVFKTQFQEKLRVAAISSLARFATPEAMERVRQGLNDPFPRVRETCRIVLKLKDA